VGLCEVLEIRQGPDAEQKILWDGIGNDGDDISLNIMVVPAGYLPQ
jgi:hypothetical protein